MLINESNVLLVCKASCKSSRELGFIFNPLNVCQLSNNANIIAENGLKCIIDTIKISLFS